MIILDKINTVEGGRIEIPFYHKGHLSLKSNTEVTVCLIPYSSETPFGNMPEVIVSPIKFSSWPHIWRITAVFRERQGIVHKLLSIVRDAEMNVLVEESSSVENRNLHEIELLVDTSAVFGRQDNSNIIREAAEALQRRIIAICIEELALMNGTPRLKVSPVKGLFHAYKKFQDALNDHTTVKPLRERTSVIGGFLEIPDFCMEFLKRYDPLKALMSSDTKDRILRILFIPTDVQFTFVRISHVDSRGALAKITGELARAFDVVTSLTRIQRQGNQNDFELLLFSDQYSRPEEEPVRRRIIENMLAQDKFRNLQLKIWYPARVWERSGRGSRPQRGSEVSDLKLRTDIPTVPAIFREKSTASILTRQVERLRHVEEGCPRFLEQMEVRSRLVFLQKLLDSEGPEHGGSPEIFVSYNFEREDLFHVAKTELAECRVWTGRDPNEDPIFRRAIIQRISYTQGFLGIWSGKGANFSPWLVWELGVAQALELPYRLLIHEEVDKSVWWPINPERNQLIFREVEFAAKVREAIEHLLREIKENQRRQNWDFRS